MTIKSDKWIRRMCEQYGLIEPFEPQQVREVEGRRVISYGTSSYGYDIRCAPEFKVFTNIHSTVVDPKNFDEKSFVDFHDDVCIIPPNSFALARTLEYFRIPRNVLTICLGKSTYARCGIIVNVTPFEPEWEGFVTLEFSNTTPLPAKIYAGEGCAQVLFFESDEVCETSYKDRGGKYHAAEGLRSVAWRIPLGLTAPRDAASSAEQKYSGRDRDHDHRNDDRPKGSRFLIRHWHRDRFPNQGINNCVCRRIRGSAQQVHHLLHHRWVKAVGVKALEAPLLQQTCHLLF
jgi:dCTP deaminase